MFINSNTNKYNNLVFRQKSANYFNLEKGVLQKVRYYFLNITRMLHVLLTKFKYNTATYDLGEYKSYTKQSQLIYS